MTNPMVSTTWLAERLDDPTIRVVDATLPLVGQPGKGRDSYDAGHIPGAAFFDINVIADQQTDLPHMLPGVGEFEAAAGALGLSRDATVVVYDAHGLYSAPRVWWTLRAMGYPNVVVLDGGLKAWRAEVRALTMVAVSPDSVVVEATLNPAMVVDLAAMRQVLERGTAQVLDARSAGRFRGEAPEPRASLRSGHMPGALNVPFNAVVNPDGTLKSVDDLKQVFAHVDLARPIVTTCGSGVTAAVLALALARLGRMDVAIYDGSWSEWGARADTAVVTGA